MQERQDTLNETIDGGNLTDDINNNLNEQLKLENTNAESDNYY